MQLQVVSQYNLSLIILYYHYLLLNCQFLGCLCPLGPWGEALCLEMSTPENVIQTADSFLFLLSHFVGNTNVYY